MRDRIQTAVLVMLTMLAFGAGSSAASAAPACDRRCLLATLTDYTEALADNDISRLQVTADVRVTSNGNVVGLGKGETWGKFRRIPYRQAFVDPETGSAVFYGTLTNAPTPEPERWWFYVVRLKVVGGRIAEVEEISYDGTLMGTPAASLVEPDRIYDSVLPPDERVGRERLFELADMYFDAVSRRIDYHRVPWHPECQRREIAMYTVNSPLIAGSCGGEFKIPRIWWNVENRRFYVADVERGVVLAIGNFMTPPAYPANNGSVVIEVFKIQDGMIRHIEAFMRGNGQLHSGWGTGKGS